jgi:hypothetical protein
VVFLFPAVAAALAIALRFALGARQLQKRSLGALRCASPGGSPQARACCVGDGPGRGAAPCTCGRATPAPGRAPCGHTPRLTHALYDVAMHGRSASRTMRIASGATRVRRSRCRRPPLPRPLLRRVRAIDTQRLRVSCSLSRPPAGSWRRRTRVSIWRRVVLYEGRRRPTTGRFAVIANRVASLLAIPRSSRSLSTPVLSCGRPAARRAHEQIASCAAIRQPVEVSRVAAFVR